MDNRSAILDLARNYDVKVATFANRLAARDALLAAVHVPSAHKYVCPGGKMVYNPQIAIERWIAAARRADAKKAA